ncbi:MAG: HlyD family secretion protein [Bacteroidetes bacterium]|nr:MAG: HlyD family secretion protein [Bacteroidota bacterium]PTM14932.1 MAG: HlyD family secretion protein [Bacteroidota bacterium]
MNDLTKRRLSIVVAVLVIIAAVLGQNYLASQKAEAPKKLQEVRVKQVEVLSVKNESISTTLDVQGQLAAFDKIELYAEVGGILKSTSRPFKIGTFFAKGASILEIDNTEAYLALLAQKSTLMNTIAQAMPDLKIDYPESFPTWEKYLNGFSVESPIKALPAAQSDREKRFVAARNLLTQYYNIKSQEERLGKYILRAPFGGVLTEANVQPGTVIRVGQKLGELMATGNYELVTTVPLADLNYIKVGNNVQLTSEDIPGQWDGRVKRISDQIDAGSQTVQVFIGVNGKDLREGMYLRGTVTARSVENAMRLPRELIVNQQAVYEVQQDSILRLLPIKLIKLEAQSAIVSGLPLGAALVNKTIPGAFEGMKVKVSTPQTPASKAGGTAIAAPRSANK